MSNIIQFKSKKQIAQEKAHKELEGMIFDLLEIGYVTEAQAGKWYSQLKRNSGEWSTITPCPAPSSKRA